ncbi:MYB-like transcription factor ETC3 [Eucalyptus grandis]|uniref:MYB-like transcription factor ETC3 n=1 Tax=Eucalyptus grandis TaxID=71139 RepID=UPI00192EC25F|nr:MYB-like transcription factor ETC3 [Eucalyptus grandis]
MEAPGKSHRRQGRIARPSDSEEVSSTEWEDIDMTEQEEDLIHRMHRLVGEKWDLIAGRIPGRSAAEIERFWIMKHRKGLAERRRERKKAKPGTFIK